MMGNYHVPCGAGEKLEITSNAYLLQPFVTYGMILEGGKYTSSYS
jgi:hypothetical protein